MWVRLISYLALGTGIRALVRCLCKRYTGCPGSVRTVFIKDIRLELFSKFQFFYSK
jgi:hypothetical protein